MKYNIVVDFSHYDDFCGFGEIARNFAPRLAEAKADDLHFIFILPKDRVGMFGDHIDYIAREDKKKADKIFTGKIDLWHATDQQYNFRLCKSGIKQLLTVHDLNFLYEKSGLHRLRHVLQIRHRVKNSHQITCISRYVRHELAKLMQSDRNMGPVIYNGISDLESIQPQQPKGIKDAQQPFFFSFGQIRAKKNFQSLVPMMKHFPDTKLYIAGDDHFDYANTLRQLIETGGQENQIILLGKINDNEKVWLYQNCKGFLFPSRLEGFGIPVLEAMRFKVPVFSSYLTSLPEVCNIYAQYWSDFDPDTMAEVVQEGLDKFNSRAADKAYEHSLQFNYDIYTQEYIRIYRKMLDKEF